MKFRGLIRTLVVAAALGLIVAGGGSPALPATQDATVPRISDLVVIAKKGRLLVFANLEGAFSPDLLELVQSGVTTRFTFELGLNHSRRFFYDQSLLAEKVVHQVKYDALKKAYTLRRGNGSGEATQKVTRSRQEMIDWMSGLNGVPIASTGALDPQGHYYVRLRAKVNSVDFAFPFNYLLAFLGQKTAWVYSTHFGPRGM